MSPWLVAVVQVCAAVSVVAVTVLLCVLVLATLAVAASSVFVLLHELRGGW